MVEPTKTFANSNMIAFVRYKLNIVSNPSGNRDEVDILLDEREVVDCGQPPRRELFVRSQ